ncbi:Iron-binding zinc finger CDGSH type [Actinacidiphila guanduensis]|uniref:Iron-binding zinc finger CDGSH type n=1 Tax=Actinacidiphila guanduensis TaxID=310781 RepID=A0A1H0NQ07_9ACTN|nr:Iron-binding zinc finger CDGSH type [Actinacidiphila guanduensis]
MPNDDEREARTATGDVHTAGDGGGPGSGGSGRRPAEAAAAPAGPRPGHTPAAGGATRVSVERGGPLLVEGPVEFVAEDGTRAYSDRFRVAVCTCRRSRTYPWCDTSHRAHERPARPHKEEQ